MNNDNSINQEFYNGATLADRNDNKGIDTGGTSTPSLHDGCKSPPLYTIGGDADDVSTTILSLSVPESSSTSAFTTATVSTNDIRNNIIFKFPISLFKLGVVILELFFVIPLIETATKLSSTTHTVCLCMNHLIN